MNPTTSPTAGLDEQALDWFIRERAGLDAIDAVELQQWRSSPDHAQALDRWQRQWEALGALPAPGIAGLRRQLAADLSQEKEGLAPRTAWWPASARGQRLGAATALAVTLIAGGLLAWQHESQQPTYAHHFASARGQQAAMTLPDGSRLRLDTATHGEVALYRERRELKLPEGQIVFEVARDPSRPFDVWAGPLRITVLGTRFAVRHTPADAQDGRVHIAVEEGLVRVAQARGGMAAVELHAGQQVDSDAAGQLGAVLQVPADGIASWRDGRVSFEDATLAQVLAEFERYAPTGLVLADAQVAELRLTGTFDPRHLENFRTVLPRVLPVRLRPRGNQVEIQAVR